MRGVRGAGALRIAHRWSSAGDRINEDALGWSQGAAWVIDGASGIARSRFTSAESDAQWYARAIGEALARHVDDSTRTLPQIFAAAVEEVRSAFVRLSGGAFEPFEAPSASAALVRTDGERVEYAVLGDCALILREAGSLRLVHDARVLELERPILDHLRSLLCAGVRAPEQLRREILPMVMAMRARMNRPDGYWVLSLDPAAAEHALTGTLQPAPGAPLVLLTDGFTRLIDGFATCTVEAFHARASEGGFERLHDELRALERADPEAQRFPRLKLSDDATGIVSAYTPGERG
jgi:Protein phosphatase 2C